MDFRLAGLVSFSVQRLILDEIVLDIIFVD